MTADPRRPRPSIDLEPDEIRRIGRDVVDLIADHWAGLGEGPPITFATRSQLDAVLRKPPPEEGVGPDEALRALVEDVLPNGQRLHHPRFFARVPSPSNAFAALIDALVVGRNTFSASWTGGSGPATVELVLLEWLAGWCGLPEGSSGAMLGGSSEALLTALVLARASRDEDEGVDRTVIYASDQAHAAAFRAARVLGIPSERARVFESDADFRLPPDDVERAIGADRAAGLVPTCVVASAGTINTGAVDDLVGLAEVCRRHGVWLHVDGAFGACAALTDEAKPLLVGLGEADSINLDPHKWLFQPYEIGCLLVRDVGLLERTFALETEYLKDVRAGGGEVNFFNRGLQLSRGARSLKLWATIRAFGVASIRAGIEHGLELARHAEARVRELPGWEVVTPASLGVVTFRKVELDDAGHRRLAASVAAAGVAALSSTELRGRTVLRLCTINPRTTRDDVDVTLESLASQPLRM